MIKLHTVLDSGYHGYFIENGARCELKSYEELVALVEQNPGAYPGVSVGAVKAVSTDAVRAAMVTGRMSLAEAKQHIHS